MWKRMRKEVMYADVLSDPQWMEAIEDGEDISAAVKVQLTKRVKRKEQQHAAIEQEVANMLEDEEEIHDDTNLELFREEDMEQPESQLSAELEGDLQIKKSEHRTRIVIKRRQNMEVMPGALQNSYNEGGESQLRIVLRPDKSAANWKGLQRKRSKHGTPTDQDKYSGLDANQDFDQENGSDDEDDTFLESM